MVGDVERHDQVATLSVPGIASSATNSFSSRSDPAMPQDQRMFPLPLTR